MVISTGEPPSPPPPASETEAMSLPPFGRAVALLCGTVAETPWRAMKFDANLGVSIRLPDQPSVLTDPYPLQTPWAYKWAATEDLILYGNHFALYGDLDYRTLRPGWVLPIAADAVWLLWNQQDPGIYSWMVNGYEVSPDEMLHIGAGNRSGELLGRGVLAQYGEWLAGPVAAESYAAGYFAGSATPPAFIQPTQLLTQPQADDVKARWRTMAATREPMLLPAGWVVTPVVSTAEQAQLTQSRTWSASEVAMVVGVPTWLLGLAGPSMTYQNVETGDIVYIKDYVSRWSNPLAEAFTKWLMPRAIEVIFDWAARMRADQQTTANVLKTYVDAGILSVDEARAVINRQPVATTTDVGTTPAGVPELTPVEVL